MRSNFVCVVAAALYPLVGCVGEPASPVPLPSVETGRFAATLAVPGDFATLREAVAAAAPGDVIEIAAGTYDQRVAVRHGPLTIRGAGIGATVIRGSFFLDADGSDWITTISDLTLESEGAGAAIDGAGAGFTVQRVEVRGYKWGIMAGESPFPIVVRSCRVEGNVWGIDFYDVRDARVVNNEVVNNTKGGIVSRSFGSVDVLHNTVVGNGFSGEADEGAGGIVFGPFGHGTAYNNIVVGNRFGINCAGCDDAMSHNAVWGNAEDYAGDASPGDGDLSVDPRLVDGPGGNFRLRAGSPCVDVGRDAAVVDDMTGGVRPAGAGPDLGAHELVLALPTVTVNEVMANPVTESSGEFVELYNWGEAAVDVAGFLLDDGDATDVIEGWDGGPTEIPGGGYGVVLDPDFAGDHDLPAEAVLLTVGDARLGNALAVGDPVRLLLPDGATAVSSFSHPFNPGNGVSAERVAPDSPDEARSWVASPCGASPGALNCVAREAPGPEPGVLSLLITEVMANPTNEATGEFVEVLNTGEAPADLAGLVLSDGDSEDVLEAFGGGPTELPAGAYAVIIDPGYAGQYEIAAGTVLLTVGNASLGNGLSTDDPVTLRAADGGLLATFSHPFDPGNGWSAELVDPALGDVARNWVAAPCDEMPFASPGRANCAAGGRVNPAGVTLVINEVMANPELEDSGEFVELLNYGAAPADAAGLVIDDGDASDALVAMGDGGTVVPAGGYALILDPEYAGQYTLPPGTVLLRPTNTTIGSGLSTNDALELKASDGVTVLSTYLHPFNPGNGVSAERIDDRGDVEGNWVASPCASKSSPGLANCASGGEGSPDPDPEPGEVPALVINEVLANPTNESRDEYVELLNIGDVPVDVGRFTLYDGDAADPILGFLGGPTVIPPGGYAVILDRDYRDRFEWHFAQGDPVLLTVDDGTICSGLSTNDPITLLMPGGVRVIDTFSHPFDPGNARSAERVSAWEPDTAANWVAAPCNPAGDLFSPGRPNCASWQVEPPEPEGQMVDVNAALPEELAQVPGIGPALSGRIVAYRDAHGGFESLEQLTVLDGVTARLIEGWARLEGDEEHFLGIDPAAESPVHVFDTVSALLAAAPDPAAPGEWVNRRVRVRRAVNLTPDDDGSARVFRFGDWGDEANFDPDPAPALLVYLSAPARAGTTVMDALADWEKEDGAPNSAALFYRWATRTTGGGRIRGNHVFAIEGDLRVYQGEWEVFVRPDTDPGLDRLVRFEKWLAPEDWRRVRGVWSYSYKPAVVEADGYTMTLPYRLVTSHPCVAYWERLTGRVPPMPRAQGGVDGGFGGYEEYNEALDGWRNAPEVPRLVINEVMYDLVGGDEGKEMIELYNPNPDAVVLSGWRMEESSGGHDFPAQGGPTVPAWGYLVLGDGGDAEIDGIPYIDYAYDGISLRNSSETIRLLDAGGGLVDEVVYDQGAPWPVGTAGRSYELIDPCSDNATGASWRESAADFSGQGHAFMTPGAPNSAMATTCPGHQDPAPDPEAVCVPERRIDCWDGCELPACLDAALADVEAYARQQAAAGGADRWDCAEPVRLGSRQVDAGGQLCGFDLACTVVLDAEGGVAGQAVCGYEPEACGRISCHFAL